MKILKTFLPSKIALDSTDDIKTLTMHLCSVGFAVIQECMDFSQKRECNIHYDFKISVATLK